MADKKIIAVLGATGSQGGGLARAILADQDGGFACRAITRDPKKDKAQALADAGAEVVAADLDDVDSLKAAFSGAHGVYAVTNFWEHFSADKEKEQAANIAAAANAAGVKHVIWSTLEDTRDLMDAGDTRMPFLQRSIACRISMRRMRRMRSLRACLSRIWSRHFTGTTFICSELHPRRVMTVPTAGRCRWVKPKWPEIAAEDIGKSAYGIFKAGDKYIGATVGIAGGTLTVQQMSDTIASVLGLSSVTYNAVDADTYRGFGFPGADELGNMFQVYRDFEAACLGARSVELTRELNPALQSYEDFVKAQKDAITAAVNS